MWGGRLDHLVHNNSLLVTASLLLASFVTFLLMLTSHLRRKLRSFLQPWISSFQYAAA